MKRYFIGFSTQNSAKTGVSTLYDIALINVDLMAAFQTRIGERVMRPDYGCKLWDYVMEPLTDSMRSKIIQETQRICQSDSRVVMQDMQVYEQDNGFRIEVTLLYQPWNVISTFSTSFEQSDSQYYGQL